MEGKTTGGDMRTIEILENNDTVASSDWCRPLGLTPLMDGMSDSYSFTSQYSGSPQNNVKWVKVCRVFGKCWYGKKVSELNKRLYPKYEFVRGCIPESHVLKEKDV